MSKAASVLLLLAFFLLPGCGLICEIAYITGSAKRPPKPDYEKTDSERLSDEMQRRNEQAMADNQKEIERMQQENRRWAEDVERQRNAQMEDAKRQLQELQNKTQHKP